MILLSTFLILTVGFNCVFAQTKPLGSYGALTNETTVSGISAGAIFAVQYHVAFSSEVIGVGVVAGVPYYCAQGLFAETTTCMYLPYMENVDKFITATDDFASQNKIDSTDNMAQDKVYIYDGKFDTVVYPENGPKIQTYYENYNAQIYTEFNIGSEHCMPTVDYGNGCAILKSPFISACDYNAAYILLNYFYGDLTENTGTVTLTGDFYEFDQSEFFSGSTTWLDTVGYAYVPSYCQTNKDCRAHLAFHGCEQGREFIGDEYARHAGYNEVAELNNLIVIYPQVIRSFSTPSNPNGCWDWWGYTDNDYAVKSGVQMDAVHQMMLRLMA